MVVTGFEVYGAVTGALGTLKLAGDLLKWLATTLNEWREAGSKIAQLTRDFNVFKVRLEVWSHKTWKIDIEIDDGAFAEYWGVEWTVILDQLTTIDEMVLDFTRILSKILPEASLRKLDGESQNWIRSKRIGSIDEWTDSTGFDERHGLRAMRTEACRWLKQRTNDSLSVAQKAEYVFFKSGVLTEYLADLNERYYRLRQDAEDFYYAQHPDLVRDASLTVRREQSASSLLLRNVLETKVASEILYWACLDLNGTTIADYEALTTHTGASKHFNVCLALELDLILSQNTRSDSGDCTMQLLYHLIVPWPDTSKQCEILIEGPTTSNQDTLPRLAEALKDIDKLRAYTAARTKSYLDFQETLRIDLSLHTKFRLMAPTEEVQFVSHRNTELANLLQLIQNQTSIESYERFPRSERINLAFKVAECGLILLGTSWLSGLKSTNIKRLSRGDSFRERRFLLESRLPEVEDIPAVEPQTFNIGVLLTEIATGQVVEEVQVIQTQRGVEYDLLMAYGRNRSSEKRYLSTAAVIGRVNQNMGFTYSKAVDFCLQQSIDCRSREWKIINHRSTWDTRKEAYHGILTDYYSEVYLPYVYLSLPLLYHG